MIGFHGNGRKSESDRSGRVSAENRGNVASDARDNRDMRAPGSAGTIVAEEQADEVYMTLREMHHEYGFEVWTQYLCVEC